MIAYPPDQNGGRGAVRDMDFPEGAQYFVVGDGCGGRIGSISIQVQLYSTNKTTISFLLQHLRVVETCVAFLGLRTARPFSHLLHAEQWRRALQHIPPQPVRVDNPFARRGIEQPCLRVRHQRALTLRRGDELHQVQLREIVLRHLHNCFVTTDKGGEQSTGLTNW